MSATSYFSQRLVRHFAPACAILFALSLTAANATTTAWFWHQTSTNVPGFEVHGKYVLTDGEGFPSVASDSPPYDFGGLVSFDVGGGDMSDVTLEDFVAPCTLSDFNCIPGLPDWNLSYQTLFFTDASDSFNWFIFPDTMVVHADSSGFCSSFDGCVTTGFWAPAPEPATIAAFASGFLLLLWRKRKSNSDTAQNKLGH